MIDNIYRIQAKLNEMWSKSKKGQYCNICFEEVCNHNQGTDSLKNATDSLSYWLDIAVAEAKQAGLLFIPEEPNIFVPRWPQPGRYSPEITNYLTLPALGLPLSVICARDNILYAFTEDGQKQYELRDSIDFRVPSNGNYWGYFWGNQFWLLRVFKNGYWNHSRQQFLSVADVPDTAPITGFWQIPKGRVKHGTFNYYLGRF